LFYVTDGEGMFRTHGIDYPLHKDSVFMFGPGIFHEIISDKTNPLCIIIIATNGNGLVPFIREHLGDTNLAFSLKNAIEFRHLFTTTLKEAEQKNRFGHDICFDFLRIIILKLAACHLQKSEDIDPSMQTYIRCRKYIDEHFSTLRSVNEIAEKCHINAAYLCRLFKRFEKTPPYEYLLGMKMNEACHLLQSTPLSIKTIAHRLSFNDPYSFSRTFKRMTGLAPRYFRDNEQAEE